MEQQPNYDEKGRMKYSPEYHSKNGTLWTYDELDYLITWYAKIGPVEMSFALERTVASINKKVADLKKSGKMEDKPNEKHFTR